MRSVLRSIRQFLSELRRRNVYRVALAYLAASFVAVELAEIASGAFGLPGWFEPMAWTVCGIGFPFALVLAWALEVTPEGVRVEETAVEETKGSGETSVPASTPRDLWVGVLVLVLSALGAWWIFGGLSGGNGSGTGPEKAPDSTRVAVFPFTVGGGEELEHLGEGMVELLGRSIDGAGGLRVVDPNTLLGRLGEETSGGVSPERACRVTAQFGAGRFVLGRVLQLGENIRLSATWYEADGSEIGTEEVTGEGQEEIQSMVDKLARAAIVDLAEGRADQRRQLVAQTTSSAEALKAYLEGQQAFRALNFEAAVKAFSEATQEDSTFALAHYRLSLALGWEGRDLLRGYRHARRAAELSEGLPERDRLLLQAHAAYRSGEAEKAESLYRTILQRSPTDAEAHYLLGEVLFHFNWLRGRPIAEARGHFRTAMQLDPSFEQAFPHRVDLAVLERDTSRLDSLTRGREEIRFQALRAYILSDGPGPALNKRIRKANSFWVLITARQLLAVEEVAGAHDLLGVLASSSQSDEMKASVLKLQARAFLMEGRLGAARRKIQDIAPLDSAAYWMGRARLAGLPFVPDTDRRSEERRRVVEGLTHWNEESVPERRLSDLHLPPKRFYPLVQLYHLGILKAGFGRAGEALLVASQLDTTEAPVLAASAPLDFARSIRAEVERQRGRPEEALAHLANLEYRASPVRVFLDPLSGARERFLRAEILAELGRPEEALRWYRTLNGPPPGGFPYLAPAHFGRAKALEELDRPDEAAEAYRRCLTLWKEADPVLQQKVEEARQRLARLEGKKD